MKENREIVAETVAGCADALQVLVDFRLQKLEAPECGNP